MLTKHTRTAFLNSATIDSGALLYHEFILLRKIHQRLTER